MGRRRYTAVSKHFTAVRSKLNGMRDGFMLCVVSPVLATKLTPFGLVCSMSIRNELQTTAYNKAELCMFDECMVIAS